MALKKITISGGSGLVGTAVTKLLQKNGYKVVHLSREAGIKNGVRAYKWDYKSGAIDEDALRDAYAVIHLAGAGIADERWTDDRKKVIIDSRVKTAALLLKGIEKAKAKPEVIVSASGINYYGCITSPKIFTETDPPAGSFIGQCCVKWEDAADTLAPLARIVKLRTAMVLSAEGGALARMDKPFKLGLGAALGNGNQYMPYIHLDDLAAMYLHAIENKDINGAYNACNQDETTNNGFSKALAKALEKPFWLPNVPTFALKLALGEMSEILLEGSRASSQKIIETGFDFKYPQLESSLRDIYRS